MDAADIENLEIDWVSGSVTVTPYDGKDIVLTESSKAEITDETCLGYGTYGRTLEIGFQRNKRKSREEHQGHVVPDPRRRL